MAMSSLIYLKKELQFKVSEWTALDQATKDWYIQAAKDEIKLLGLDKE